MDKQPKHSDSLVFEAHEGLTRPRKYGYGSMFTKYDFLFQAKSVFYYKFLGNFMYVFLSLRYNLINFYKVCAERNSSTFPN